MRIRSLDGLRAISIALVLYGHLNGTRGFGVHHIPLGDVANLGVRVFFCISGFLITTLLLEEVSTTQRVDLYAFYQRRAFRIFPAFYVYLAAIVAGAAIGWYVLPLRDILFAATYTNNYEPVRTWYLGHIWSLSVEEQFYLLWPATLWLLGTRRALWAAAVVVLLCPLFRMAWWYGLPHQRGMIGEAFPTIADAIAVGCVLAGARDWLGKREGYLRFLRSPAFVVVPLLALGVNALYTHIRVYMLVGHTVLNVCCALIVDRCIRFSDGAVGRFLNSRVLSYIGVLSYSIYLWQQPFLNHASPSPLCSFPLNLLCVAALALASYHLVEKPFLRLRRRFARSEPAPRTSDASEQAA